MFLNKPLIEKEFTKYNKNDFTKQDHINLKNEIDILHGKNIKFLLSNSNTDFIKNLYKEYKIEEITTNAVLNCKADKRKNSYKELLVKNF
jgi:DNA adenine methylase